MDVDGKKPIVAKIGTLASRVDLSIHVRIVLFTSVAILHAWLPLPPCTHAMIKADSRERAEHRTS